MTSTHLYMLSAISLLHRRHRWVLGLLLITLMFPFGCAQRDTSLVSLPEQQQDTASPEPYRIAPEDVIEIMVWKNPDLSREATVRPDGRISVPLIGDVYAAEHTSTELAEIIAERLKPFYRKPPEVTVMVRQTNSHAIYILGEVANQGRFVVGNGVTLLQALALAGGFTEFATRSKKVIVRRKLPGEEEIAITTKYKKILAGIEKNLVLERGDTIIVP